MVTIYIPDRGDIVWLGFDPQLGHEQSGRRPTIVLSDKSYNQTVGLMLVCPITSKVKNYPFEVRIKTDVIDGVILADQIKSLDWRRRDASFIAKSSAETIRKALLLIKALLEY